MLKKLNSSLFSFFIGPTLTIAIPAQADTHVFSSAPWRLTFLVVDAGEGRHDGEALV